MVINEIHYDSQSKNGCGRVCRTPQCRRKETSTCPAGVFPDGIQYTFPANTTLEPGGQLVVSLRTRPELRRKFKLSASVVFGPYINRLSNGEVLTLRDAVDQSVDPGGLRLWFSLANGGEWRRQFDGADSSLARQPTWAVRGVRQGCKLSAGEPVTFIASRPISGWRYREGTSEASSPQIRLAHA